MAPRSSFISSSSLAEDEDEGSKSASSSTVTSTRRLIDHNAYYLSSILLIFLGPALGGFLYGYDIGATSFAITSMNDDSFNNEDNATDDNDGSIWRIGVFVAAPSIAAFIGSMIMFPLADRIGRRQELIYGSILYMIGAFWQVAPFLFAAMRTTTTMTSEEGEEYYEQPKIYWLGFFCGRFIYGLGIGVTMHGAPAYLGEMLPSAIRGALLSLKEVFIVLGMLLGYIFGYAYFNSGTTTTSGGDQLDGWAYAYVWSLVVSIAMFVTLQFLPYSYRWLLSRGRFDEALVSLRYVYKPGYAEEQFEALIESTSLIINNNDDTTEQKQKQQQERGSSGLFISSGDLFRGVSRNKSNQLFKPQYRSSLMAGLGLVILQQITGQPSISSYAAPILASVGLASYSSILLGFFKLITTFMAVMAVERYGRKRLLLIGCSIMVMALLLLFILFHTKESDDNDDDEKSRVSFQDVIILMAMFLYIGGYQFGFGPITWLLMGEIFPISIRGQAVSMAVQLNFLLNSIVQILVPMLEDVIGLANTFGLFGILTLYSIHFIHRHVIETQGLTLEEIEMKYNSNNINITTPVESDDDEDGDNIIDSDSDDDEELIGRRIVIS